MSKDILTRDDLLRKTGVREESLEEWLKTGLVRPAGFTDDRTPLFGAEAPDRIAHIRKLYDFGYGSEEIQKIFKKVGLPKDKAGKTTKLKKHLYLTVGDLAESSGVSPRTIKHWEEKGIIEPNMRTEGGFRLYSESYIFLCQLIRDLQLFGYSLGQIKALSGEVRSLMAFQADLEAFPKAEAEAKLTVMLGEIHSLFDKMKLIKKGVERWEGILKKKKKDIQELRSRNLKRPGPDRESKKGDSNV